MKTQEIPFQRRYDCAMCKIDCRGAWPPSASTGYKALFCIIESDDEFNSARDETPRKRTKYRCATTGAQWNPPQWIDG